MPGRRAGLAGAPHLLLLPYPLADILLAVINLASSPH
ncbi:hypothetical protein QFZ32_009236 [Streptomyces canus]|uniref:Rod shape-determining protein MreD n=1 Tax=Streptomyces canus TaxID=58343 RepID=A0AAW8FVF9_9ACTN|nr:hypothetical protein [Streptomyces canus]MDQ1073708.1 hypothetical protein [Streptomyces canus]